MRLKRKRVKMKISPLTKAVAMIASVVVIFAGCAMLTKPNAKSVEASVAPLQSVDGRNYCSSSQITYKGKRFTMTNVHCCAAMPVERADGNLAVIVGGELKNILYVSQKNDLCLVEPTSAKPLTIARGETLPDDKVYMMGYPFGTGPVFEEGVILAKYEIIMVGFLNFYIVDMITAMSFPGNSGSPVLNKYGQVIGLLFAGSDEYPFLGAIVPLKLIRADLDEYVNQSK